MTTIVESTNGRQAWKCDGGATIPLASVPTSITSKAQLARLERAKKVGYFEGYFDDVAAVFSANQHPIIFVDEAAMRWMGSNVYPEHNVDLLVKDDQFDDILADFLATGLFELVEQELQCRLDDVYTEKIPRLRHIDKRQVLSRACLNLWPECVYKLSITSISDELVEVQDVFALSLNLVEERFDPCAGQEMSLNGPGKLARGVPILWPVHGLSAKAKCPLYIPSLPRFIDALLDQIRWREEAHPEAHLVGDEFSPALPSYHVTNLICYLHLEKPSQRERLLPMLAVRNRADMEIRLNRFKRKKV